MKIKSSLWIIGIFLILIGGFLSWKSFVSQETPRSQTPTSTSIPKIKILIMPGHEAEYGGAEYSDLDERDMVVDIADILASKLSADPRFEVIVARDKKSWNPILQTYFTEHEEEINDWIDEKKKEGRLIEKLNAEEKTGESANQIEQVQHNKASEDTAFHLYAINKWADENNIDATIHLHINDYPRSKPQEPGKYSGFSIYVPDNAYHNATSSEELASNIFFNLSTKYGVSNLPIESAGIVKDRQLIAIGRYDTSNNPSLVIEYDYIYEDIFKTDEMRKKTYETMAELTSEGLGNFFKR